MPKSREQLHIGAPFHRDMWGQHCSFQKMRILVSSVQGTPSLRCRGTWNAGRRLPSEPGAVRPKEEDGLGVWSSWMPTDPVGSAGHCPSVECSHQGPPDDRRSLCAVLCPAGAPPAPPLSASLPWGSACAGNRRGAGRPGALPRAGCSQGPGTGDRQVISTSRSVSRV